MNGVGHWVDSSKPSFLPYEVIIMIGGASFLGSIEELPNKACLAACFYSSVRYRPKKKAMGLLIKLSEYFLEAFFVIDGAIF